MRRTLSCLIFGCALSAGGAVAAEMSEAEAFLLSPAREARCGEADDRVQVMILGTYHMANPGADVFNLESDDVLTPRRQEEIAQTVEDLAVFAPDKVLLEALWGSDDLQEAYALYIGGQSELTRNERQQIGFRLAHRLGHSTVYGADAPGRFDLEGVQRLAQENERLGSRFSRLHAVGGAAISLMNGWLADGTVGAMLRKMNDPDLLFRSHQAYIDIFAGIVSGDDYAGADLVGDWYTRNLRVFANVERTAVAGDRLLVLFGQGHVQLLRDFVETSESMCLVDPLDYLS